MNNEQEQVNTLQNLQCMLKELYTDNSKQVALTVNFNSFFDVALEAIGERPCSKQKQRFSIDLFDIWRIRKPTKKSFCFRKKHFSHFIQYHLDYIFTSKSL